MTINIANFFVIFDEDDVLYNLVGFQSDRMSPRESVKNWRSRVKSQVKNIRKTSDWAQFDYPLKFLNPGTPALRNTGAPGAGRTCHFRLSSLILRDTEVIATNAFFHK